MRLSYRRRSISLWHVSKICIGSQVVELEDLLEARKLVERARAS